MANKTSVAPGEKLMIRPGARASLRSAPSLPVTVCGNAAAAGADGGGVPEAGTVAARVAVARAESVSLPDEQAAASGERTVTKTASRGTMRRQALCGRDMIGVLAQLRCREGRPRALGRAAMW